RPSRRARGAARAPARAAGDPARMSDGGLPPAYARALAAAGAASLAALQGLEWVQRRLHPPDTPRLRSRLGPVRDRLEDALDALRAAEPPPELVPFHEQLALGAGEALAALSLFLDPAPPPEAVARILESLRRGCRALEAFYPLRSVLPPIGRHFVEPPWHDRLADLDPDPAPAFGAGVGMHRAGAGDALDDRGGFSLYVPEWLAGDAPRPLVVALHGGSGHGRDFLWTWVRE